MERNITYFISDLHLGARYLPDRRAHEEHVAAFLRSIASDAKALYLVGDVLDYWYEYRTVVPRGYVRFFGALAELADAGVRIATLAADKGLGLRIVIVCADNRSATFALEYSEQELADAAK